MKLDHDFYTKLQLCEMLGKSVCTFNRWLRTGKFPPAGVHGVWSRFVVERWLAAGQTSLKDVKEFA